MIFGIGTDIVEVARIEEPGLAEDAFDIERQISQVKARDLTRLQEIEKLRAQFASVAADERRPTAATLPADPP